MPKRSSIKQTQNANASTVSTIKQEAVVPVQLIALTDDGKNAAAVALGRLGGLKGGKARATKLSKARRSEIAAKAAQARWSRASCANNVNATHGKKKKTDEHGRQFN